MTDDSDSHAEAVSEAMRDALAAKWHCDKEATLSRAVAGKFCAFKAGEIVKVKWDDGITCLIERREWAGALPLCNQLAGVPRMFLNDFT